MDRLQLQTLLEEILGSSNVYFQPPASLRMQYPCIRYRRDGIDTKFADNKPYAHKTRYELTVIDRNPDSLIPDRIKLLPLCSHSSSFTADNLNHDVFVVYF